MNSMKENRSNINTLSNTGDIYGTIHGTVKDSLGNPINSALVQLMSILYSPVKHNTTDSTGSYSLKNVFPGIYKIYSIAPGKILPSGNIITVVPSEDLQVDFTLQDDSAMNLTLIAGDVFDLSSKTPLKGATVSLYYGIGNNQTLSALTNTNKYGQFTFRDVPLGLYTVTVNALGYVSSSSSVKAITPGQISPLKVSLNKDASNTGTVSGVIKNENGNSIDSADVILYRVEQDNTLTPISFTKTNSDGVYLFQNIPQATYKIKSNESTVVTIILPISPNYYKFTIANNTFLPTDVILLDGANIQTDITGTQYIDGVSKGQGEIIFSVIVTTSNLYDFNISYSCTDDRVCNIKINNVLIENQVFNFPPTGGSLKILTTTLPLTQGINTITVFNN